MVKGRIVGQACVKCFRYDFNHSVNFTLTATLMSVPFKSEWWGFFVVSSSFGESCAQCRGLLLPQQP